MTYFLDKISFLIHPSLAKRIEKDPFFQKKFASFLGKIKALPMDSGLVPKKLKQGDNNLLNSEQVKKLPCVIQQNVSPESREGTCFWGFWQVMIKIARRQLSPPPCKDAYEIEIAKDTPGC